MSQPGDTFFDFFDEEPAPAGPAGLRGRLPRRRGGGRPTPPRPLAPLARLLALVFFILFLLLVFGLLIDSCAGESRHSADAGYMNDVNSLAQQSSADGSHAVDVLVTPGLTVSGMAKRLDDIAGAEQQNLSSAQSLSPPGRLRSENADLIEALQLRVSGLHGLATTLASAAGSKQTSQERRAESRTLAQQAYELLASDIVWDDLFLAPAQAQLRADGVGGVTVPESHFLSTQDSALFVTPDEMRVVLDRILAAAAPSGTCSGLHGTSLVSVQALPSGTNSTPETLTPGSKLNYVTSTLNLLFRVTIEDSGDFQEVGVKVQLTVGKTGGPITRTGTVPVIDRGQQAYVDLGNLGDAPFGTPTTLNVNVQKVCGETNLSDNSAQYKVYFQLP